MRQIERAHGRVIDAGEGDSVVAAEDDGLAVGRESMADDAGEGFAVIQAEAVVFGKGRAIGASAELIRDDGGHQGSEHGCGEAREQRPPDTARRIDRGRDDGSAGAGLTTGGLKREGQIARRLEAKLRALLQAMAQNAIER